MSQIKLLTLDEVALLQKCFTCSEDNVLPLLTTFNRGQKEWRSITHPDDIDCYRLWDSQDDLNSDKNCIIVDKHNMDTVSMKPNQAPPLYQDCRHVLFSGSPSINYLESIMGYIPAISLKDDKLWTWTSQTGQIYYFEKMVE